MGIKDTRAEAQQKLTRVQRKVARLRREKGVQFEGSGVDPRISRASIGKMSARELSKFIQRANEFTNRKTQYVAGSGGVPLDAARVSRLARKESILKQRHDKIMQGIGDMQAPFTGMSIRNAEQMRPTVKTGGEAFARTFSRDMTNFANVVSNEALAKLEEWRDKQLSPTYARARVNSSRDEARAMLAKIGVPELSARFEKLSDEQFFTMWEYGPYAGNISLLYEIAMGLDDDTPMSMAESEQYESITDELNSVLEWAESIKPNVNLGAPTNQRREPGKRAQATAKRNARAAQKRT